MKFGIIFSVEICQIGVSRKREESRRAYNIWQCTGPRALECPSPDYTMRVAAQVECLLGKPWMQECLEGLSTAAMQRLPSLAGKPKTSYKDNELSTTILS